MGQGLYNLVGWGVLDPPHIKGSDDATDALFDEMYDLGIQRSCESEPDYLVVRLAVDDGFLQDCWQLPALPERIWLCSARKARYAEHQTCFPVTVKAREQWQSAKLRFEKAGLALPDAKLVIINDWD